MHRDVGRIGTSILVACLSLSGVAVAADALITTDREELDGFLDDVTREKLEARIDGALGHVNPSVAPVKVSLDGKVQQFQEGDSLELAEAVRGAMGVFDTTRQSLLQHSVKLDGERATVTTRLGDTGYEQTVIYDLVRREQRWLVRAVRFL